MAWIPPQPTFTINEISQYARISRTKIYAEIKAGRLKIRKCGTRTLVLSEDLYTWLHNLPKPKEDPVPNYENN